MQGRLDEKKFLVDSSVLRPGVSRRSPPLLRAPVLASLRRRDRHHEIGSQLSPARSLRPSGTETRSSPSRMEIAFGGRATSSELIG